MNPRWSSVHADDGSTVWFAPGVCIVASDDCVPRRPALVYVKSRTAYGRSGVQTLMRIFTGAEIPVRALATVGSAVEESDTPERPMRFLVDRSTGDVVEAWDHRRASWRRLRARLKAFALSRTPTVH